MGYKMTGICIDCKGPCTKKAKRCSKCYGESKVIFESGMLCISRHNYKDGAISLKMGKRGKGFDISKKTGDTSELYACAYLLENGYEAFRNVSAAGPIDIISIKDKEITLIDVKTVSFHLTKGKVKINIPTLRKDQKEQGVKLLFVTHSGHVSFDREELVDIVQEAWDRQKPEPEPEWKITVE